MLRSNTAHLQSEDKSAEPPQEQRPRRRVTKKEEDSHLPLFRTPWRSVFELFLGGFGKDLGVEIHNSRSRNSHSILKVYN